MADRGSETPGLMAHRLNDTEDLTNFGIPAQWKRIAPADAGDLNDCVAVRVTELSAGGTGGFENARNQNTMVVLFENDEQEPLEFTARSLEYRGLIKAVLSTGSDMGVDGMALDGVTARDGSIYLSNHIYGAFLSARTDSVIDAPRITNDDEPIALAANAQTTAELFTVTAEDPHRHPITFTKASGHATLTIASGTGIVTYTRGTDALPRGDYFIDVTATSASGQTDTRRFTVRVANSAPVYATAASSATLLYSPAMNPVYIDFARFPEAVDADGDDVIYTLFDDLEPGFSFNPLTRYMTFRQIDRGGPLVKGDYDFRLAATDGYGGQDEHTLTVTQENHPPRITQNFGQFNLVRTVENLAVFQFHATDDDGDALQWGLLGNPPNGLSVGVNTGLLAYTPDTPPALAARYQVQIRAFDGTGGHSVVFHVELNN